VAAREGIGCRDMEANAPLPLPREPQVREGRMLPWLRSLWLLGAAVDLAAAEAMLRANRTACATPSEPTPVQRALLDVLATTRQAM